MLDRFKGDLPGLSSRQIFRKYLLSGDAHSIDAEALFDIRETICDFLGTEYPEVVLVGSAKLGFSIKPKKRFEQFGEESDLDFAVVSGPLFERIWKETHSFNATGAYWPDSSVFFKYLSRGWIRPDKLPRSDSFIFGNEWWDFFRQLSQNKSSKGLPVRGGLYQSWFFFEQYQIKAIDQCKDEVTS